MAFRRAVGLRGGTVSPVTPSRTISGMAITLVLMHGLPALIASMDAIEKQSSRVGRTKRSQFE